MIFRLIRPQKWKIRRIILCKIITKSPDTQVPYLNKALEEGPKLSRLGYCVEKAGTLGERWGQ